MPVRLPHGPIVDPVIDRGPRNLHRQEGAAAFRITWRSACGRGKAKVLQPFENQVGVHRIAGCNLCYRNARSQRLCADRSLLFVSPEPLLLTLLARHEVPQDVHHRCWTLSDQNYVSHRGDSGRIHKKAAPPFWNGLRRTTSNGITWTRASRSKTALSRLSMVACMTSA